MKDVIEKGTGTPARLNSMPAAGKTGTTENSTDLWISAYTPYYTCSVWGGYDENKPMDSISQSWHMTLWKNIMDRVHEGLEYKDFSMPSSVEQKTICTKTGLLAVDGCPSLTEYFAKGTVPTQSCSGHKSESDDSEKDKDDDKDTSDTGDTNNGDTGNETGGSDSGGETGGGDSGGDTGGGDSGGGTGGGDSGGDTGGGDSGGGTGGGDSGGGTGGGDSGGGSGEGTGQ